MRRQTLLLPGLLLVVGALLLVPLGSKTTNCGGNSAALSAVRAYVSLARCEATDYPDHGFRVTEDTPQRRMILTALPGASWLNHAHFLVSTAPLTAQSTERWVIIVCDTPYANVPERWFGFVSPAHAVGFADGRVELMSSAAFAALDRSSFVALDRLYPRKSK